MAINFPASPSLNDTFTSGGVTYTFDGTVWAASGSAAFLVTGEGIDALGDVDTSTAAPTDGQALVYDNTAGKWEPGTISGATDLSYTSSTRVLASSTGTNATLPEVAASGDSGLMTGADKAKLDGIASGAEANAVDSVNTQTGAVVLDADDIDDTSTTHKFATAAQLSAADSAVQPGDNVSTLTNDAGYITDYTVTSGDVTAHEGDLTIAQSQVTNLNTNLGNKADLVGGVIPNSQLPSLAISEYLGTAADQAALLAFSGQRGDWAIRTDTGSTWVITTDGGSSISDWTELATPADAVTSVNGFQGTVVLSSTDVGAVPATGGQFTGNIEIGTGVDLNTDGTATFAGGNVSLGNGFIGTQNGASKFVNVNVEAGGEDIAFIASTSASHLDYTSKIFLDGSAEFTSTVKSQVGASGTTAFNAGYTTSTDHFIVRGNGTIVGNDLSGATESNYKYKIDSNGSATFASTVESGTFATSSGARLRDSGAVQIRRDVAGENVFEVYQGGSAAGQITASIDSDGNATFDGGITATSFDLASLSELP